MKIGYTQIHVPIVRPCRWPVLSRRGVTCALVEREGCCFRPIAAGGKSDIPGLEARPSRVSLEFLYGADREAANEGGQEEHR